MKDISLLEIQKLMDNEDNFKKVYDKNGKIIGETMSINSISDEARKNINKTFNELYNQYML